MKTIENELRIIDETDFEYRGRVLVMRFYNDDVWELLDEQGLPICQGKVVTESKEAKTTSVLDSGYLL